MHKVTLFINLTGSGKAIIVMPMMAHENLKEMVFSGNSEREDPPILSV